MHYIKFFISMEIYFSTGFNLIASTLSIWLSAWEPGIADSKFTYIYLPSTAISSLSAGICTVLFILPVFIFFVPVPDGLYIFNSFVYFANSSLNSNILTGLPVILLFADFKKFVTEIPWYFLW